MLFYDAEQYSISFDPAESSNQMGSTGIQGVNFPEASTIRQRWFVNSFYAHQISFQEVGLCQPLEIQKSQKSLYVQEKSSCVHEKYFFEQGRLRLRRRTTRTPSKDDSSSGTYALRCSPSQTLSVPRRCVNAGALARGLFTMALTNPFLSRNWAF